MLGDAGGCDRMGTVPLNVTYRSGPSRAITPYDFLASLRKVEGAVNPRWSDTVELRFEDGTVLRPQIVWVSEPIRQGFFYVPIGKEHHRPGHQLREVVALNADGDVVEGDDSMWQAQRRRPYSDAPPSGAVVESAKQETRVQTPGGEAVLWCAPSRFETGCTWLSLAGRYYNPSCRIKGYPSRRIDLVRDGEVLLLYGVGLRSSDSIKLHFADGHHIMLQPNSEGDLLYRIAAPPSVASGRPRGYSVFGVNGKKLSHSPLWLPPR